MSTYSITYQQRVDDYGVVTLLSNAPLNVGDSVTTTGLNHGLNGTYQVYALPQHLVTGVDQYGNLTVDLGVPIPNQVVFYDAGQDVAREAVSPYGVLTTGTCTWITAGDIEDWLGIPVATVADQTFLTQCAAAANAFCYRRRQEAGYVDSLTNVPNGSVKLGTIQYGGMLYRQRGSIDDFASFNQNGATAVTGLSGVIKQLLGIDRPQVA
jgi:hypothetical protein